MPETPTLITSLEAGTRMGARLSFVTGTGLEYNLSSRQPDDRDAIAKGHDHWIDPFPN